MEKSRFFTELDQKLRTIVDENPLFSCLCKAIKDKDIVLTQEYDSQKVLARLKEFKDVLDKIGAIILSPYQTTKQQEVILRSEVSGALSTESFQKTMRDPSLWREKDGNMEPMEVYSSEKTDSYILYENKFICLLLDLIEIEVKSIRENGLYVSRPLVDFSKDQKLMFSDYSLLNRFKPFESPYTINLSLMNNDSEELLDFCNKVYHKIRAYTSTPFYKTVSKYTISRNVMPTNILIHDPLYNYCYRFYKNNYLLSKDDESQMDVSYYNYCFLTFLKKLFDIDKTGAFLHMHTPISLDEEGRLHFEGFLIQRGYFEYRIIEDKENLAFTIQSKLLGSDVFVETGSYYLLASYSLSRLNKESVYQKLKKEQENYNDVLLITMENTLKDYDHVLSLSYYFSDTNQLWDNLISYTTLLLNTKADIFLSRCPCCGSKIVQAHNNNRHCPNCNSDYAFEEIGDIKMIWVKALWRKSL